MDKLPADIPKDNKPQQTVVAPAQTHISSGDPALWSKVTQRSLGKVYIQGQGWLEVGPNGPIPGGKQRVGGVKTRDQVSREVIEKAAAKKGVDVATYLQLQEQQETRMLLDRKISDIQFKLNTLR